MPLFKIKTFNPIEGEKYSAGYAFAHDAQAAAAKYTARFIGVVRSVTMVASDLDVVGRHEED